MKLELERETKKKKTEKKRNEHKHMKTKFSSFLGPPESRILDWTTYEEYFLSIPKIQHPSFRRTLLFLW
jgi:hypothetical protein